MPIALACLIPFLGGSRGLRADPELAPFAGIRELQESSVERRSWFERARFGMFIHWGLYSAAGGYWPPDPNQGKRYPQHYAEWIKHWANVPEPGYGESLKPLFQPDKDCMRQWATLAKEAGMGYAVLTTKHHEGYTLFNSQAPYSVKNDTTGGTNISPNGRDLVAEYADAFRAAGIVPGFYYSLIDWQHPQGEPYKPYLFQHLDELATNYGDVGILWVDYSSAQTQGSHWGTRSILENWHRKQPKAIYNNRFWNHLENDCGDFFTPEKYVPSGGFPNRAFEVCHTINESFGFSYHDDKWKSPREIAELLVDIVSKGGNLLLNVGPDRHGRIPEASAVALRKVGQWLEKHREAIEDTSASPFVKTPFAGRCTLGQRSGRHTLYCHLFEWPKDGILTLTGLESPIQAVRMMDNPTSALQWIAAESGPSIKLPSAQPQTLLPVVEISLGTAAKVQNLPYPRQAADRSIELSAADAMIANTTGEPKAGMEDDHIGFWFSLNDSLWFSFLMDRPQSVVHTGGSAKQSAGSYEVWVNYACKPQSGGLMEIRLLDQTLTHAVQATASWRDFRNTMVGTIQISQPGLLALHARPLRIDGEGLANVRKITLKPATP